jgi:Flp pilus assembly protein CpaB
MRLLIVFAILIVLVAVVVAFLLPQLSGQGQQPAAPGQPVVQQQQPREALPTATPLQLVEIAIAVQDLPRGFRIPPNAITLAPYPADLAPFNAITDLEEVIGKIARTDIFREQPILSNLIVEDLTAIADVGSDAAAILPSNLVAVALPIDRITSVAYAIQDGDRVDLIMSMLFVDVDEIFQSIVPNRITLFNVSEDGTINFLEGIEGRPDTTTFGPVIIGPSERQRPRLVTQRTIQDAFVVHVGNFPIGGRFIGVPPTPTPVPVEEEETGRGTPPPPTATPERPDIITLGVPPQEAVVITWAVEARIPITLALRSATDTSRIPTDPVTMDYIMNEYNITLPVKRNYALEPAIRSIRQLVAGDEISLAEAEQE